MEDIDVHNPANGRKVGSVRVTAMEAIADTVARIREAQRAWKSRSFSQRAGVIRRFHDRMIADRDRIFDVLQSETGKTRRDALAEVVTVAGTARYYLTHGAHHLGVHRRQAAIPGLTHAEFSHHPHGVVGLITPWNYPFLLSVADAIPALLAGNGVVVKPSELTPLSAVIGRELLVDSGLDPDLFVLVHGGGAAAEEVIRHVDYIGFTGSTATGRKVALAAAGRLIPFSLELGGKNPMIVLRDAPLAQAARALLAGAFANSGQTCISIERVYVEATVLEQFASLVAEGVKQMKLGYSTDWDLDMGSLIHAGHADKVMGHIADAQSTGAAVIAGGRRRLDLGPAFVEPTVLGNVADQAMLRTQETFGPVVALYAVSGRDEAIARANDSQYGLNASVWAGGRAEAVAVARQLNVGSVAINSTLLIYNSFDVPMGGVRDSGIGRRHAEHGILRYTQAHSVVSSFAAAGGYDSVLMSVKTGRVADALMRVVGLLRRLPGAR